ncbi:hypothetical protein AKJ16_DCAP16966 [Drosera capensis]
MPRLATRRLSSATQTSYVAAAKGQFIAASAGAHETELPQLAARDSSQQNLFRKPSNVISTKKMTNRTTSRLHVEKLKDPMVQDLAEEDGTWEDHFAASYDEELDRLGLAFFDPDDDSDFVFPSSPDDEEEKKMKKLEIDFHLQLNSKKTIESDYC